MSLLQRLVTTLSAKANELLDRVDDPREALDYACQLVFEQLGRVQQAVTHLVTARQDLVLGSARLEKRAGEFEAQARACVSAGRDDMAREALARRHVLKAGATSMSAETDQLVDEDERFIDAARLLEGKVENLRVTKESLKASYALSGDKAEIERAISEVRAEAASVRVVIQRAEDQASLRRAQLGRVDALLASGPLRDLAATPEAISSELRDVRGCGEVEHELRTIKRTAQ